MHGYDSTSYGEAFADVYDDWYGDVSDVGSTVEALARLADRTPGAPVVELGVGTGRLALPLAERISPTEVWGIDSSPSMLARIHDKHPPANLRLVVGDMVAELAGVARPGSGVDEAGGPGRLGVVFVAFNTFFNLASAALQQQCFDAVAGRLCPEGSFVIEALVPVEPAQRGDHIEVKSLDAGRVVLSVVRYDGQQQVEGQFVELTEAGGVRLRPWSIRYASPIELDAMAATAGLVLRERWESFDAEPFDDVSARHVSVYSLPVQA